ncbi:putative Kinase [Melia azedarach]|uniref:Kinase n=1 Tax=Melia azedarach TaxID=155640 RepID=A0ACC1X027_MELAZ|nr:putative Kinase [Melia azedarach]
MAILTISLAFLLLFFPLLALSSGEVEFIFNGFNETQNNPSLTLERASIIKPSGALRLTNSSKDMIGHAFYPRPIKMFVENSTKVSSFSTSFVFAILTPIPGQGGFGLAFTIAPLTEFPGAEPGHFLGIFNSGNDGNDSNHVFAVEFDTVDGYNETSDSEGNHVGININSMKSLLVEPAAYYDNTKEDITLEKGKPIQAWIEYDGLKKLVNVTICPMGEKKPSKPLLSAPINNLSSVFKEDMYVGFSASTGKKASSHYILGWSFAMSETSPSLNLSQLPLPPIEKRSSSSLTLQIKILLAALSVSIVVLLGILVSFKLYRRLTQFEILEDWELDCPHRFRYKDLYTATKGFKESEVIGVGGFGEVYKGVLPTSASEIAVKKISRNSIQGMREFAAEIESLGRLRHKHLVNLQGWCKRKNDLLLVYDYIPNGSLDSPLYEPDKNFLLSWENRFNIIKGVAAGLLYLHEEWEQVVVHRDVKSSNVLIDADMNARLGDFGLARLFDHGKLSHTTSVVGTIGYIAPELARTGKASCSTDVFAYGVLLLELATGRRPIDSDHFILVDWVLEFKHLGQILDVVDPNLGSSYVVEEMELVLGLGLICSHQKAEARPTVRQVLRYLNGDELLPVINDWSSVDHSQRSEMNLRLLEIISADMITNSQVSSSLGGISSGSLESGR